MDKIEIAEVKNEEINLLSILATSILREHYDPIVGTEQNDYMLDKFQSEKAIKGQIEHGYIYYWGRYDGKNVGFIGFYPIENKLYLSKFYIMKEYRGKKNRKEIL